MINGLGSISYEQIRAEQGGMEAQHFFQHPKFSPMAGYSAKYRLNNQPFRFLFLLLFPPFILFSFFFPLPFLLKKEKERMEIGISSYLFSYFSSTPNHFSLCYKYDRKVVLLIFNKKVGRALEAALPCVKKFRKQAGENSFLKLILL